MNNDVIDQAIADAKPELRKLLVRAFRSAAAHVDRDKLDKALKQHDRAAILAALGISPDGTHWDDLEMDIRNALAAVLIPVFSHVALGAWEALGTDFTESDIDPAAFDAIVADAGTLILGDTLDGIQQAITLILAGAAYGLGTAHLLAAIGLTAKQATLFIAANRNAIRLHDALAAAPNTDAARAIVVRDFLAKLPTLIASPIRKMIAQGSGLFTLDNIRTLSKNLARGLLDYRANALSEINTASVANLTEVMVWQEAQRQGLLRNDARKYWVTRHDERVRHTHTQIESANSDGVPLDEGFKNPLGLTLFAPPAEINCRCRVSLSKH